MVPVRHSASAECLHARGGFAKGLRAGGLQEGSRMPASVAKFSPGMSGTDFGAEAREIVKERRCACFRNQSGGDRTCADPERFRTGAQPVEPAVAGIPWKLLGNLPSQLCQMATKLAAKPLFVPPGGRRSSHLAGNTTSGPCLRCGQPRLREGSASGPDRVVKPCRPGFQGGRMRRVVGAC